MRRDYEDGMIDLIFYCIGSNFVDILGIVGMLEAAFKLNIAKGTTDPRVEFCLPK